MSRFRLFMVRAQTWITLMLNKKTVFICPVCMYPDLDEAPYDSFGCASYNICPCCGTEFGYDDSSVTHLALRQRWRESGMRWWSVSQSPPQGWSAELQLKGMRSAEE